MKRIAGCLILFVLGAAPMHAQGRRAPTADLAVGSARDLWQQLSGFITQAAEDMPEAKYGYKPTPEVRSFGQLIGHLAGSQYMFCAAALGDTARAEADVEKSTTSKADLVAAMRASNAYCARAYRQTDIASRRPLQLFGQPRTRLYALMINATHDGEHYGNMVTYLRLNGMVPPSSRGQ